MSETSVHLEEVMPLIQERLAQGGTVQFTPRGTSMLPMLLGGRDQVVLAPVRDRLRKYDLPLYRRENGQYVLHRIVKAGETYTCIGDNQFVYESGLRQDQMLAVVTEFVRKGKTYSVTQLRYRIYCRVWHGSRTVRQWGLGCVSRLRRLFSRPVRE